MFCKVIAAGNLGKDPEVRYIANGTAVASFNLAVNRQWTDKQSGEKKKETTWIPVEVFGKLAEVCGEHLKKGSQALIEGRLKLDQWEKDGQKKERMKVIADEVRFIGGKPQAGEHPNIANARDTLRSGSEREPGSDDDVGF
jgi:single-strand DNA-binding protein